MKIVVATFTSLVLALPVLGADGDQDYQTQFEAMDSDSSSSLSQEEFEANGNVTEQFSQYDLDGNGEITLEEFMSMKKAKDNQREGTGGDTGWGSGDSYSPDDAYNE